MCVYFSVLRLGLIFKLVMQRRSWTVDAIMVSSSWMMLFVLGFSLPKDLSVKLEYLELDFSLESEPEDLVLS